MGSRIYVQICKKFALLIIIVVIFITCLGCPPGEWRPILFQRNGKYIKKLKLELIEDKAHLIIYGFSSVQSKFLIRLFIEAKYDSPPYDIYYNPASLHILANNIMMNEDPAQGIYYSDSVAKKEFLSRTSYLVFSEFFCEPRHVIKYDTNGMRVPANIAIVCDKFAFAYKQEIIIDTIRAREF